MSLISKTTRFAASLSPTSPLRASLLRILTSARRRDPDDPTPTTNLHGYMDDFKATLHRSYPTIDGALGLQRGDAKVEMTFVGDNGHLKVTTNGGTDLEITVDGKRGDHRLEGFAQGHKLQPKTFPFRPAKMGLSGGTADAILTYIEDNMVGTYTYRVCTNNRCKDYGSLDDLLREYQPTGTQSGQSVRKELVGQPVLRGLVGPMWDGRKGDIATIRYEDAETYRRHST